MRIMMRMTRKRMTSRDWMQRVVEYGQQHWQTDIFAIAIAEANLENSRINKEWKRMSQYHLETVSGRARTTYTRARVTCKSDNCTSTCRAIAKTRPGQTAQVSST